jgi:hypothetical protein
MARKPRSNKGTPAASAALVEALQFIAYAQQEVGAPYQTHCQMQNGYLWATDGVLTAGCRIADELTANPHTMRLIDALLNCGQSLAITQLPGRLSIKSGGFRALVPCAESDVFASMPPDAVCGALDERLRVALATVGVLATVGAQKVVAASVLLGPGYAVATNTTAMLQCWHGLDTPPNIVLPKKTVEVLAKITKPLKGFGYSHSSMTFYFEDDSWLRTQLFDEKWPEWQALFTKGEPYDTQPLPENFAAAVKAVKPFCDGNFVYLLGNKVKSHLDDSGADYDLASEVDLHTAANVKDLQLVLPYMEHVDFGGNGRHIYFHTDTLRGMLAAVSVPPKVE